MKKRSSVQQEESILILADENIHWSWSSPESRLQ